MHYVPDRFRWIPATQDQFIQKTKEMVQLLVEKKMVTIWGSLKQEMPCINEKVYERFAECRYREGRLIGALKISFGDFLRRACPISWSRYDRNYQIGRSRSSWCYPHCPYRNGNSYRRRDTDSPKDHEPTPRECWREEKQFRRDQGKGRGWRHRPKAGISTWKTKAAREHRRWVADRLYHEDWDAFGWQEYKSTIDAWDYD